MKKMIISIVSALVIAFMLVSSACTEESATTTIDSPAQNVMKMIPSGWNVFAYLDAKEMRADTHETEGLSDIWDWGEEYLDSLSTAAEIDPDQWPLSMNSIDYLAISAGGLQQNEERSFVFIIGGTFNISAVSTYLGNFDTNYPDSGTSFAQSTYKGVETWSPVIVDPHTQVDPDVLLALIKGSSVAIVGNIDAVKDCIDVINGSGDNDSMLADQGVKDLSMHLREAILTVIIDGDVALPNYENDPYYQNYPDYPESLDGTAGFGISKVGDTLQLEIIAQMNDWSQWQSFLTEELPDAGYFPNLFGATRYIGRGEDEARKTEKRNIEVAVINLMVENELSMIPNPWGTTPTNDMTAFPDPLSTTVDKLIAPSGTAYDFVAGDQVGYVLYQHDKTADDLATLLHNYVNFNRSTYFYTVDNDGTVHQWADAAKTGGEHTN